MKKMLSKKRTQRGNLIKGVSTVRFRIHPIVTQLSVSLIECFVRFLHCLRLVATPMGKESSSQSSDRECLYPPCDGHAQSATGGSAARSCGDKRGVGADHLHLAPKLGFSRHGKVESGRWTCWRSARILFPHGGGQITTMTMATLFIHPSCSYVFPVGLIV